MPTVSAPHRHHRGGDERAEGVVQIKDLIEGKRLSGEIEDNASWREARVAQITAPEAELVAKVRGFWSIMQRTFAAPLKGTEAMAILALDHLQLAMPVGREDEARAFYGDLLGFAEQAKP